MCACKRPKQHGEVLKAVRAQLADRCVLRAVRVLGRNALKRDIPNAPPPRLRNSFATKTSRR